MLLSVRDKIRGSVVQFGPCSIAFTPDKNRTYAESFGLPAMYGHTKGSETARTIIRECFDLGIRDVIFWAMSQSNIFKRTKTERDHLVELLKKEINRQEKEGEEYGFYFCGRWRTHVNDPELEDLIVRAHERTAKYQQQRLTVLFAYRGITDWKQAAAHVARKFGPDAIEDEDEGRFRDHMWIRHLPPHIDMLLRTGADEFNQHNSDSFLPLQGEHAYTRQIPIPWPRFTVEDLHQELVHYAQCKRLKGA